MTDRKDRIVQIIDREGSLTFHNLKKNFPKISDATLRRDLDALDRANRIIRVHGGVKSINIKAGNDTSFSQRARLHTKEKQAIAKEASKRVTANASVYVDSGSTLMELCCIYPNIPGLIFTTGVNSALQLGCLSEPKIYLLGGLMSKENLDLAGPASIAFLKNLHFNIAFMGAIGYSPEIGFSVGTEDIAQLKRTIISRTEKVFILLDSSRIGVADTFSFADISSVHTLITDSNIDPKMAAHIRAAGTELVIVDLSENEND